ncbi:ABC transporter ATP-binding protein [Pseudomonas oryzihabitans]|uniref:ABC transporter ATP-binding protein n=1 Tax=Pseudomonas oryzihabitans TaxID=47885 RepID=UPI0016571E1E|nr:ATP-binding cassette domain-containing protein [Pseudomonas oryzihabitans]
MKLIDSILEMENVTVDIPLRGVRDIPKDPRIIKSKNGGYFLRALDNVSLSLVRGDRVGIVGGNGNGKTTLLKVIAGMLPIASGNIEVKGTLRALLSIDTGNFQALTGRQNAILQYSLLGIEAVSLKDYIDDVIEFSDLGSFIDMPIATYSPGMRGRLLFAMNTVEPADILLLDEWLGVADINFQKKAHDRLVEYIEKNEGFLFASHNHDLLMAMTDRRIELNKGKVFDAEF